MKILHSLPVQYPRTGSLMHHIQQIVSAGAGFSTEQIDRAFDDFVFYAARMYNASPSTFFAGNAEMVDGTRLRAHDMAFVLTLDDSAEHGGTTIADVRAHELAFAVATGMKPRGNVRKVGVLIIESDSGYGQA